MSFQQSCSAVYSIISEHLFLRTPLDGCFCMLKSANGREMSLKATSCKFSIKSFSGPKIKYMSDYIKPFLQEDPNHFILHIGINCITNASKSGELIAEEILELVLKLKIKTHEVSISNVIVRRRQMECKGAEGEQTSERTMQEI